MRWKKIAVISACIMAFGITSYASGGVESIQAYLNHDFKFTLNNNAWVPKDSDGVVLTPVILNGTSYLPVKAVVEATGGEVQWNEATKTIAITSANGESVTAKQKEFTSEELRIIQEKLRNYWDELGRTYSIRLMSVGSTQEHLEVEIRKFGEFEKNLSSEEIYSIKKSLFKFVGKEFPLKLRVIQCCRQEANIIGEIIKTDKVNKKVLIENHEKKVGNSENPDATWVTLTEDGKIVVKDSKQLQVFSDLSIGQQVKAWSVGITFLSYPGQASVVKIEIQSNK
ncbi:hypothetical protein QFZ81_000495 [Paenibacillus sp. V4I9]|uniref:stalk domain-containing protein n=1 Tax=Paenibacillus sp. V4I9 TaxID=3042308 RepID=UPI002788ADD0|nr:stalk domain-containing protein [Paenibacillus sp. V4I9]MDQ0885407.1 hypothetical protein [Paenibacillus sp. V4I9]